MALAVPQTDVQNFALYSQILIYQSMLRPANLGGQGLDGLAAGAGIADRLLAAQTQLVLNLVASGNLNAAYILSSSTYPQTNPLIAAIAAQTALAASYGNTGPGFAALETVAQMQLQLLGELMSSGQLPASTILSAQSYGGPSAAGTL